MGVVPTCRHGTAPPVALPWRHGGLLIAAQLSMDVNAGVTHGILEVGEGSCAPLSRVHVVERHK
jgi:hypothetical protein